LPRTKEQNEEIRRQRKETILRSALKVYAEKGYRAAEIGDIAEQSGMARGLVYYYYKDKLNLFRELFGYMFTLSRNHAHNHFSQEASVSPLLESFVNIMYQRMLEHPEYVVFFMRMRHDLPVIFSEEELKDFKWHVEYLQVITETLERGMASSEIRRMNPKLLVSQFWGAVMHGLVAIQQRMQELQAEGKSQDEIASAIGPDIADAVAVCMAIVKPQMKGDHEE
jgi:AcrR family transcriptional regulator